MFSATSRKFLANISRCKVAASYNAIKSTRMMLSSMSTTERLFSSDNFMSGANANYMEAMYAQWR